MQGLACESSDSEFSAMESTGQPSQAQLAKVFGQNVQLLQRLSETVEQFGQTLSHLSAQSSASTSTSAAAPGSIDIQAIIKSLPKAIHPQVQHMMREVKQRHVQWQTSKEVLQKYERMVEDDVVPGALRMSPHAIQWPRFYLSCASPVPHPFDADFVAGGEMAYDLPGRFERLVRLQQRQLRDYLCLHASACVDVAAERCRRPALLAVADDVITTYLNAFVGTLEATEIIAKQNHLSEKLYSIIDILREQSTFQVMTRLEKTKAKEEERRKAQAEVECKLDELTPVALVALAAQHVGKREGSGKAQGKGQAVNEAFQRALDSQKQNLLDLGFNTDGSVHHDPSSKGRSSSKSSRRSSRASSTSRKGKGRGINKGKSKGKGKMQQSRGSSVTSMKSHGKSDAKSDKGMRKGKKTKGAGKGKGRSAKHVSFS